MLRLFLFIAFFLLSAGRTFAEDRQLAELLMKNGIQGTMVIRSLKSDRSFIFDDMRARRRVSPASTFKIFNTLIVLQEHAVTPENNLLKWDGTHYDFPEWNRDQTLESAFRVSCVWYYQELARKVGAEKYRRYLHEAGYGRLSEPFETDSFWLDGSLLISPVEQVKFLKKVYLLTLSFSSSVYDKLAEIMVSEKGQGYTVRAKTGWAARVKPQIGWYVGYVETADDVWFFATNIDIRSDADLPLRKKLVFEALKVKNIIR